MAEKKLEDRLRIGDVVVATEWRTCLAPGTIGVVDGLVEGGVRDIAHVRWFGGASPWGAQDYAAPFVGPLTLEQRDWLRAASGQRDVVVDRLR